MDRSLLSGNCPVVSTLESELISSSLALITFSLYVGFKYIVQVQLVENLGQGGRGELTLLKHLSGFIFRA